MSTFHVLYPPELTVIIVVAVVVVVVALHSYYDRNLKCDCKTRLSFEQREPSCVVITDQDLSDGNHCCHVVHQDALGTAPSTSAIVD